MFFRAKAGNFTSQDNFDVLIPIILLTTPESSKKTIQGIFCVFLYMFPVYIKNRKIQVSKKSESNEIF